jgi:hypothetical protein
VLQILLSRSRVCLAYSTPDSGTLKEYTFVNGRLKTRDRISDNGVAGKIMGGGGGAHNIGREDIAWIDAY